MNNVVPQRALNILMVCLNYAPEMVGCGKYNSELAEYLAGKGHAVRVVCPPPYYPEWRVPKDYVAKGLRRETLNGVELFRVPIYVPGSPSGWRRVAHLASFGHAARLAGRSVLEGFNADLVFAVAPTLAAAGPALSIARKAGARTWLHVQDFEVDAAFELGVLRGAVVKSVALRFERSILRSFDRVSSISPAMVRMLNMKRFGSSDGDAFEFRNWVDVDAHAWPTSSDTEFRKELGISTDRVIALYSGNMAGKQGLENLAGVARYVGAAGAAIEFVFCGGGPGRPALEAACSNLPNVRFMDLQPSERLPELLRTADIHLLPQRAEAADLVLPSKLTGMLASGRPVIAMAEPGSGLADEVDGCGVAVAPNAEAMAKAVLELAGAPERRHVLGTAARRRSETHWRRSAIIDRFEAETMALMTGVRPR